MPSAHFRFYNSLNDFLSAIKKEAWIAYNFNGNPAVKDAIEAIGIPHVEVGVIVVNTAAVLFNYHLQNDDRVEVYPVNTSSALVQNDLPLNALPTDYKFVLDVHLGTLTRALRMLGFDTIYENNYTDKVIADIAQNQDRIVLTRDVGLLKQKAIKWGYWLRTQHLETQLTEVIQYYKLKNAFKPFTRCSACNGIIEPVAKEKIVDRVPPKTIGYFNEFYQCQLCKRIYWKGSHYERMVAFIKKIETLPGINYVLLLLNLFAVSNAVLTAV